MDFTTYNDDINHESDAVFGRGTAREAIIWGTFQFNGPFPTLHATERTMLFGIYANTYLHGMNYLSEINDISLAQMIANYDNDIARLTNEETQLVIEIVAKEYLEDIDRQIHNANMITGQRKLNALDDEYDAREDALEADRAAIVTKQAEVQLAWDRSYQRIRELETKIKLESVALQLVEVEITEQELRSAKADLELIEAGLKGLDIQLAITQTGIDITNTDLDITEAGNKVSEIGIQVSETEVNESEVDLDIVNAGVGLSKSQAEGAKIGIDIVGVGAKISDIQLQVAETELKEDQIAAEISGIEADTMKLELVDSELIIVQSDKAIAIAENALLVSEKDMIDSQKDNVISETSFISNQKTIQESLDSKLLENSRGEHDFNMGISQKETTFEDGIKNIKMPAFEAKKTLADQKKTMRLEDAGYKKDLLDFQGDIKVYKYGKEVEHFQLIQDANIVNALTHSIGQA